MSPAILLRRSVAASALTALAIGLATTSPSLGATAVGHGSLTVQPSPSVAAQITVDGVARNQPAISDLPLAVGQHRVCLSAVPGYLPPPCETVEIVEGEATALAPLYVRSGTLHVATEPSQSEAVISIDGSARDTGELQLPLAVGTHEVCFGSVAEMTTPPCATVEIVADAMAEVVGAYLPATAEPEPAPEPEPAEEARLTVSLTGQAHSSGGNKPWSAIVTITLHDGAGLPLGGTTVSGTWTTSRPAADVISSCVTSDVGTCQVHARDMSTGSGNNATFVVDHVAAEPGPDLSGHSSITVNRNGSVTVH